jgi:ergothioneine biosynthesis protein EgtB
MINPAELARPLLQERFQTVRGLSQQICQSLTAEDCCIQSMPQASPTRWHLAHTTWFFETFVLSGQPRYQSRHPQYGFLFNSYYNAVGQQFPQAERGLLSRPTLAEVWQYRQEVDEAVVAMLQQMPEQQLQEVASVLELGLQHEQQHQELMLTDIKHLFSKSPLFPTYRCAEFATPKGAPSNRQRWWSYEEGIHEVGHAGDGFAYDNESPRHRVFLEPFSLADSLVTTAEYLAFMLDGGYQRPELWLSEGWVSVSQGCWNSPLYWQNQGGQWLQFTLAGLQPLDPQRPVCHVSYFEADAYARWCGARLPTEAEWEIAAGTLPPGDDDRGGFLDLLLRSKAAIHPTAATPGGDHPWQMLGDAWEWTSSSYAPYPGYRPPLGALGEYNGKFMCNQYVLRGGSCASVSDHLRISYRNFFPAATRWQFSGIRLAKSR